MPQDFSKKFNKVNIEISNICNLQCSFCPPVERDKKTMSLEMFNHLLPQVAPITEQVTLHLMGDPLVHPQLGEFLNVCFLNQVPVFFVTNGVLLNQVKADLLLHPIIRQVNFSLHSFHDNYGDKDPSLYLEKIFTFANKAFETRPDLYINFRLWNLSEPKGQEIKNHCMLKRIFEAFDCEQNPADFLVDVRKNKSFKIKNRLYLHFDTEFTWPSLDLQPLGDKGTCLGLSNHFGVLADGTVVPCCLDKEGLIPLGHISKNSITEILNSDVAQNILLGFKKNKLNNPLCQRCNYIQRFS